MDDQDWKNSPEDHSHRLTLNRHRQWPIRSRLQESAETSRVHLSIEKIMKENNRPGVLLENELNCRPLKARKAGGGSFIPPRSDGRKDKCQFFGFAFSICSAAESRFCITGLAPSAFPDRLPPTVSSSSDQRTQSKEKSPFPLRPGFSGSKFPQQDNKVQQQCCRPYGEQHC